MQLEKLISTNREQTTKIADLTRAAAQREALVGQLQAQLAQARLQAQTAQQTAQQQAQFEKEQKPKPAGWQVAEAEAHAG